MTDEVVAAEVSLDNQVAASVVVRLPEAALAARLRAALGGLAAAAPHAGATHVAVERARGAWVVTGPRALRRDGVTDDDLVALLEWMVVEELRASIPHVTQLHGAAAQVGDVAVVVVGPSGAGKSALAYAWSRSGFPVYGDDIVLVTADGRVHAFPRLGKLVTPVAVAQGADVADTIEWMPGAEEVWFDPAAGGGWATPAVPALVARVQFRPDAPFHCVPCSPTAMVADLHGHVVTARGAPWEALSRLVADATACTVSYGDAATAAAALADRVR